MSKFYYKVVRFKSYSYTFTSTYTDDTEFKSVATMLNFKYRLYYNIGETTTAKTGGVFIFDTLENAKLFSQSMIGKKILKVTADNVWKPKNIANPYFLDYLVEYRKMHKKIDWKRIGQIDIPQGTLCAKSIFVVGEA